MFTNHTNHMALYMFYKFYILKIGMLLVNLIIRHDLTLQHAQYVPTTKRKAGSNWPSTAFQDDPPSDFPWEKWCAGGVDQLT